jgi:glutamine synthetase
MKLDNTINHKIAEYVWIDGNMNLRTKSKTVFLKNNEVDFDMWNFDGSSTNQANAEHSEVILQPIAYFKNPFYEKDDSYLVLCDTYTRDINEPNKLIPSKTNNRFQSELIFEKNLDLKPTFGIEQEYFMFDNQGNLPLIGTETINQGDYYCGVGNTNIQFRNLVQKHYIYCLNAGIQISGTNAEVAPNQWEFQVGPVEGIAAADQLWMARYILVRLAEEYDINISFAPKPIEDMSVNGSGLHTNFSTTETMEENGIEKIYEYIEKLKEKHQEHIKVYGDNEKRLSGTCETSSINDFSWGVGNRSTSVRIGNDIALEKKGYFEDRRPASDADPYQVVSKLFETCCL